MLDVTGGTDARFAPHAPAAGETIARLAHVDRWFAQGGDRNYVLRDVSLEIRAGEFVSIMGPSGAGKSTLLNVLGLHDADWSGEFFLLGRPVHSLSIKERHTLRNANIGFVFQSYNLLDDLTVYENLGLPLSYRDLPKAVREARVAEALDRFGMVAKKDLYPRQLSGGQQQLVAVARALVIQPRLILADEPTGNLHSDQGRDIMELFQRLNRDGTTIVQVTHSETNAAYGHRVVRMRDGFVDRAASGTIAAAPTREGGAR
jgi:ABC-type lipoprotein export system ATPase subunit